jgi:hypothetical protein
MVNAPRNDDAPAAGEPALRVIRGDAAPEELAAIIAVLMSRPDDDEPPPAAPRPAWSDRSALLRHPVHPSPVAWRRSGLPG